MYDTSIIQPAFQFLVAIREVLHTGQLLNGIGIKGYSCSPHSLKFFVCGFFAGAQYRSPEGIFYIPVKPSAIRCHPLCQHRHTSQFL